MQRRSAGGSIDNEQTAVAVMPKRRASMAVEMMLTALASVRIALRKSPCSPSPMASPTPSPMAISLPLIGSIIAFTTVVNASNGKPVGPAVVRKWRPFVR
jgi:hypothetical protein